MRPLDGGLLGGLERICSFRLFLFDDRRHYRSSNGRCILLVLQLLSESNGCSSAGLGSVKDDLVSRSASGQGFFPDLILQGFACGIDGSGRRCDPLF